MYDNGGGSTSIIQYTPTSVSVCNGQWHSISVTKSGTEGILVVDNNTTITGSTGLAGFVSVNIDTPLYIGGLPGMCNIWTHMYTGMYLYWIEPCFNFQ